ncbi:hypothetical protein BDY21DRAFT_356883 [Lineolata rhizophorae]|uniref:Glycoside hydrolase superfamily n=1 Tax=Lineolata rhizophorae TaxID=578093 RepID=A0A6A6NP10_9PEZI|nr:hypothetical protein BDY21DRAFT_356883 [Lineolata rhizophorae]
MHIEYLGALVAVWLSLASRAGAYAQGPQPHWSFGGVNHQNLPLLEPDERDRVITELVRANASAIRIFIRADETHPDIERTLGEVDYSVLDLYDDTLAAIYRIGEGQTKVIIAPHDVHALRGDNGKLCDAYCESVGKSWLSFYSKENYRDHYRNRLTKVFAEYPSKNFDGATWNTLNQIILGVDIQNEPFGGVYPIPIAEPWICKTAKFMKNDIRLGENNIAVITGGISGSNEAMTSRNFPNSVWACDEIDVIGIHGYYSDSDQSMAGTNWADLFVRGGTLASKALGSGKLLLAEEFTFVPYEDNLEQKAANIFDQGQALNCRGIPWVYSSLTQGPTNGIGDLNVDGDEHSPTEALRSILKQASTSLSDFDWSSYAPKPSSTDPHFQLAENPFFPEQGDCVGGCPGWLCDVTDDCGSGLVCRNNVCEVCEVGCSSMSCNPSSPCQPGLVCIKGVCKEPAEEADLPCGHGTCFDAKCTNDLFGLAAQCPYCDKRHFQCPSSPCVNAGDCDTDEQCEWYRCKPCTSGCAGDQCSASRQCSTGHCNEYGYCDYAQGTIRAPLQPPRKGLTNVPRKGSVWRGKGKEKGPSKVKDKAKFKVQEPGPMAT